MLKLAIQSKGRLNEKTIALLAKSGIRVNDSKRHLVTRADGFPLEVLYLRDDDIPQAVAMGVADIGIVGQNEVEEKRPEVSTETSYVDEVMPLGFGACRLSLAVPDNVPYPGLEFFQGKKIATSYSAILQRFLDSKGIKAKICPIEGSVEIAPSIGMADAIFDIVSSGATLLSNGLVEVEKVTDSQAVLIANPALDESKLRLLGQLKFRIQSIMQSNGMKYVLMNLPENRLAEAQAIIPGMRSPTVLPLAQEGWISVHAVIAEERLWESVERLKQVGAEGILVLALENMIR